MIPTTVYSALGPITVSEEHEQVKDAVLGRFWPERRCITIEPDQCEQAKLQTTKHEWIHVSLSDQGIYENMLTAKQCEVLCDILGTHLAGAILAGYLHFHGDK